MQNDRLKGCKQIMSTSMSKLNSFIDVFYHQIRNGNTTSWYFYFLFLSQ